MTLEIDRASLLVRVAGSESLASIERELSAEGLTIGITADLLVQTRANTVAAWLASGAPGAESSFADPADHLVAGLTATLADGLSTLEVRPSPRRAVGPDLLALCIGAGDRFASVDHVWLRVHLADARRVALPVDNLDLDPPLSDEEADLLDAIARELAHGPQR